MSPRFRPGRLSGPCLWLSLSQPELTQSYEREKDCAGDRQLWRWRMTAFQRESLDWSWDRTGD